VLFPIRDDQPTIRQPRVTIALIVINSAIFIISQWLGPEGYRELIYSYGFTPYYYFSAPPTIQLPLGYMFTPITSMFLHGGWMHLIGNMLFLWIYGNNIEDYFGPVKFLIFYLIAGLIAVAAYTLPNIDSQVPLVGASGAIAGVMGAYIILHPKAQVTCLLFLFFITFITLPAKVVLGLWFAYQLLFTVLDSAGGSGVAYLAHVGGFVFGVAALWLIVKIRGKGGTPQGGQRVYRVHW